MNKQQTLDQIKTLLTQSPLVVHQILLLASNCTELDFTDSVTYNGQDEGRYVATNDLQLEMSFSHDGIKYSIWGRR